MEMHFGNESYIGVLASYYLEFRNQRVKIILLVYQHLFHYYVCWPYCFFSFCFIFLFTLS